MKTTNEGGMEIDTIETVEELVALAIKSATQRKKEGSIEKFESQAELIVSEAVGWVGADNIRLSDDITIESVLRQLDHAFVVAREDREDAYETKIYGVADRMEMVMNKILKDASKIIDAALAEYMNDADRKKYLGIDNQKKR